MVDSKIPLIIRSVLNLVALYLKGGNKGGITVLHANRIATCILLL
jgi:hypothetical protein